MTETKTKATFSDFVVGTKVLSANNSQPGIVIAVDSQDRWFDSGYNWFEVEWERHKGGKTRIYHRNPTFNDDSDNFGGLPTIVERFDWENDEPTDAEIQAMSVPELNEWASKEFDGGEVVGVTYVDVLSNAREAAKNALNKSIVPGEGNSVGIDINIFLAALSANGWVYAPNA